MSGIEALREIYNDHETNGDGKFAVIIVISTLYREGVSLSDVRRVYIAGAELTRSDLIQSVARAIRLCSSSGLTWDPVHGWIIQIFLQRLLWNSAVRKDPNSKMKLEESLGQMLRAINPYGPKFYKAMDYMTDLLSGSGVDKLLFNALNSAGANAIQLPLEKTART